MANKKVISVQQMTAFLSTYVGFYVTDILGRKIDVQKCYDEWLKKEKIDLTD